MCLAVAWSGKDVYKRIEPHLEALRLVTDVLGIGRTITAVNFMVKREIYYSPKDRATWFRLRINPRLDSDEGKSA